MLRTSAEPLTTAYDLAMFDLDGVVYVGEHAVAGAPAAIGSARRTGMHIAFVTNSAARPPEVVAAHLTALGVDAAPADVVTSAQAAAHLIRERFGRGARIFLVGGPGLDEALRAEGLAPVTETAADPVAVATGYGPDLPWRQIMQGAVLINGGLPWVASNSDLTIPTSFGIGPGHGVLVRMLTDFTGVVPTVAGKPERALLDETVRRVGGQRPLMIGDRLDTDIEGAHNAGLDSLLVLTGVTGLPELVSADPQHRPTYLAPDLAGLLAAHQAPKMTAGGGHTLGGWHGFVVESGLRVEGEGSPADWWRVVATTAWDHRDRTGVVPSVTHVVPPSGSGHLGR
ncbi:HAD-IIA family hydrolase [Nocardioides cavernaquae]|uniref:HAD-IIA family hydrolase n=1 Tax=Nocardioides cavernaquae TaxID=2321396 RepID=A0A3A5H9K0_9ACTN|nr:HAD-IIA family hydrolase [Nocardioides cavernaquae]RJS47303.1 HAD-IIA family hydrolase [Nocardioides cavernaquae]